MESVEDKMFAISLKCHPFYLGEGIRGLRLLLMNKYKMYKCATPIKFSIKSTAGYKK